MLRNVAILVVTYNRIDYLKKWIDNYPKLLLCPGYNLRIYIVNNASTDNTEDYLRGICKNDEKIKYITLNENLGGAGGFSAGMKWVFSDNNDFVWGMDDDAFPHSDSLQILLNEYRNLRNKYGEYICLSSNSTQNLNRLDDIERIYSWMFVGFFMPKLIYYEIGNPREDFFIYCDDAEYAKRICRKYKIFRVNKSVIDHSVGGPLKIEGRFYRINMWCYELPNWKQYYYVRNQLLMWDITEKRFWGVVYHNILYCISVLCVNRKQLRYVLLGMLHGLLRMSGKRMVP